MGVDTITTGVDDVLAFLKGKNRVPLQEVADALKVPLETLQAWTDFLVEEKILGIEYKFTKPFIYLNKEEPTHKRGQRPVVPIDQVKREYFERAKQKQIPTTKVPELWRAHVQEALGAKKQFFIEQAKRRNAPYPELLWAEYCRDLIARCA